MSDRALASPSPHLRIVAHAAPSSEAQRAAGAAVDLARELARDERLASDRRVDDLRPRRFEPAPSLCLADSRQPSLSHRHPSRAALIQLRARTRAGDGDFVATWRSPEPAWASYCTRTLGLGEPRWLHPRPSGRAPRLPTDCWIDRDVRGELVAALRGGRLRYLQPYQATQPVWQLARLLRAKSGRRVEVVGPPPGLSACVNDKVWFARQVHRLFGDRYLPPTRSAGNLATVTHMVRRLAETSRSVVVKLPDASGGTGNLVLDATEIRGRTLGETRGWLRIRLAPLDWHGESELLVSGWESDVLQSPSSQLWIPPAGEGEPVVEGIFEQIVGGRRGEFLGTRPAHLPQRILDDIVDHSWLLARLFQELGYTGRCSLDLLLVGATLADSRVELIESNGRWGGTSLPMSLVQRLTGDWARTPFTVRSFTVPGLERVGAAEVLACLDPELYTAELPERRLVLFNMTAHEAGREIAALAFGADAIEREEYLTRAVIGPLERLAAAAAGSPGQSGSTAAPTSGSTSSTDASGTSRHSSCEIGSEATTTAR
jgi:hypothetical protein